MMNITYRNNPILKLIYIGSLNGVGYQERDRFMQNIDWMNGLWKNVSKYFEDIKILAIPFAKAWIINKKKIDKLIDNELLQSIVCGSIIVNKNTICYYIKNTTYIFFGFSGNILTFCISANNKGINYYFSSFFENYLKEYIDSIKDLDGYENYKEYYDYGITLWANYVLSILTFIKYAPIELKSISKNSKLKDFHCKYNNQTNLNISIIDSTWFTTTIRNIPFNVRGHFRLQRCGHGLNDKKIVWIEEFQKSGYKRKFKRPITKYDLIFGKPNIN